MTVAHAATAAFVGTVVLPGSVDEHMAVVAETKMVVDAMVIELQVVVGQLYQPPCFVVADAKPIVAGLVAFEVYSSAFLFTKHVMKMFNFFSVCSLLQLQHNNDITRLYHLLHQHLLLQLQPWYIQQPCLNLRSHGCKIHRHPYNGRHILKVHQLFRISMYELSLHDKSCYIPSGIDMRRAGETADSLFKLVGQGTNLC